MDHIDPKAKLYAIATMKFMSDAKIDAEMAKCRLACKDCHHKTNTSQRERGEFKVRQATLSL
jgi:hypothetical protein